MLRFAHSLFGYTIQMPLKWRILDNIPYTIIYYVFYKRSRDFFVDNSYFIFKVFPQNELLLGQILNRSDIIFTSRVLDENWCNMSKVALL